MSDYFLPNDEQWLRRSFLVTNKQLSEADHRNSMWSDATLKFTDTTIGGSIAINPPPQFTKFADIPSIPEGDNVRGMSRYYSEAIDDNSQVVHFRMGIPRFNALSSFYQGAYNPVADVAAKSGRLNAAFFEIGRAAGFIVSIMSFKLLMVRALGAGLRLLTQAPSSKYYYFSPTMHTYWSAVTTMLNQLSVNRGIIPRLGGDSQKFLNDDYQFDDEAKLMMHNLLGPVFTKGGQIDVFALANKASRLMKQKADAMVEKIDNSGVSDPYSVIGSIKLDTGKMTDTGGDGLQKYLERWYATDQSTLGIVSSSAINLKDDSPIKSPTEGHDVETSEGFFSGWTKLKEFFLAEANDGGQFASFRVNQTGPISESFSNSVGESSVASKLNSMSASAREVNFSLAGGNVVEGVGAAVEAVKSLVKGGLSTLGLSGLAALAGSAFFDIPKVWESATASLPRANYSIKLNSPYGNSISQLFNIYIPLCMLLAMALPKSTGKQSYTSPFLIEYYDRGRSQSRLGIIDSMSITRGTSSLGFNNDGKPLAMDISFSVIDLSSIMHMPISMGIDPIGDLTKVVTSGVAGGLAGGPVGAAAGTAIAAALSTGIFDDSNVYSDYLAVLAGMGVNDQIYDFRKLKLNLTRKLANWNSWASVSNLASFTGNLPIPGRAFSLFFPGVQF